MNKTSHSYSSESVPEIGSTNSQPAGPSSNTLLICKSKQYECFKIMNTNESGKGKMKSQALHNVNPNVFPQCSVVVGRIR